jgi:hypothetical protein
MRPPSVGTNTVKDWLKSSSIQASSIKIDANWISFTATAEQANAMMDAKFVTYRSTVRDDIAAVRTREVFLPSSIIQYVQLIHPTTQFAQFQQRNVHVNSF